MIEDHDRALEYDLMTRTGRTLGEYLKMGASGLVALISFVTHLPPDSALTKDMNPKDEFGEWYSEYKTNAILADLFDLFAAAHAKKGRQIKPYPRPRATRSIGKGAVSIADFWAWWNKER